MGLGPEHADLSEDGGTVTSPTRLSPGQPGKDSSHSLQLQNNGKIGKKKSSSFQPQSHFLLALPGCPKGRRDTRLHYLRPHIRYKEVGCLVLAQPPNEETTEVCLPFLNESERPSCLVPRGRVRSANHVRETRVDWYLLKTAPPNTTRCSVPRKSTVRFTEHLLCAVTALDLVHIIDTQ